MLGTDCLQEMLSDLALGLDCMHGELPDSILELDRLQSLVVSDGVSVLSGVLH